MSKHLPVTSHCHTRKLQHEHTTKESISADRARKEGRKDTGEQGQGKDGVISASQRKGHKRMRMKGHAHMYSTQTGSRAHPPPPSSPHLHELRHLGAEPLVQCLELPAAQRGAACRVGGRRQRAA